ncbi:hypothetical protein [Kineococcus halophytocola]|uniref:hypothetical protein n=1 Tax=Kineococcus halophytocola TaxID=3234027 RepID=UPI00351A43C7
MRALHQPPDGLTHLAGGGPSTALRNGFYATTVPHLLGDALATGVLAAPADGPVSWTGPDALDLADVARLLADLTRHPVERAVVEGEQWVADQVAAGVPEGAALFTLGMVRASRAGEFAVVDPALPELLGRPATPLRDLRGTAVGGR